MKSNKKNNSISKIKKESKNNINSSVKNTLLGKVLIPFVDSNTGIPYVENEDIELNEKRYEELLNLGLVSYAKKSNKKETDPDKIEDPEKDGETDPDKIEDPEKDGETDPDKIEDPEKDGETDPDKIEDLENDKEMNSNKIEN